MISFSARARSPRSRPRRDAARHRGRSAADDRGSARNRRVGARTKPAPAPPRRSAGRAPSEARARAKTARNSRGRGLSGGSIMFLVAFCRRNATIFFASPAVHRYDFRPCPARCLAMLAAGLNSRPKTPNSRRGSCKPCAAQTRGAGQSCRTPACGRCGDHRRRHRRGLPRRPSRARRVPAAAARHRQFAARRHPRLPRAGRIRIPRPRRTRENRITT